MMRFHAAISGALGTLLVIPVLAGQGSIATLKDALAGTERALEVLKGIEKRFGEDPAAVMGLVLSATEPESGTEEERDQRLEALRSEVNLLQMELDARQSPVIGADGAVQSALGGREPLAVLRPATQTGVTTGLDDALRDLLGAGVRAPARRDPLASRKRADGAAFEGSGSAREGSEPAYSADPLRHGIACYRAGRFAEAHELLAPLEEGNALYWQARALERLERIDEAITIMERAIARGGAGFDPRRAQTDLEFLRWKRDFVKTLPARPAGASEAPAPRKEGQR